MTPVISIVVPCYNSEATLEDTLNSILNQEFQNWETIIINDGSPDNLEEIALNWVKKDTRFKYFKKENGGLGSARNYGIKKALGAYILPLDSDNKIRPQFISNALKKFNENVALGVVYGDAQCFGEKQSFWKVGAFNLHKLLKHNYIDACAIIKKQVFDEIGFFDENMPHQGHEDWDFWLRVASSNYKFFYLQETAFDYRITHNSMIKSFNEEMLNDNIGYIHKKHYALYSQAFEELLESYEKQHNEYEVLKEDYDKLKIKFNESFMQKVIKFVKKKI